MSHPKLSKNQAGFSAVEALLIVIILAIIGGTGYYVWHSKHNADKSLSTAAQSQPATITKKPTTPKTTLTDVTLASSQMKVSYDPNMWKVEYNTSDSTQQCGKSDSFALDYKGNANFTTGFQFGQCGKGGGSCKDATPACTIDSKTLATVKLSASQTAYVIATKIDYNSSEKVSAYSLWLHDSSSCSTDMCILTVPTLDTKTGVVFGQFVGEGAIPGNPQSLDDFVKLAPVQAALTVLKTAHY